MHPERRVVLDSIRCDNLPPHPLSIKIYGKPKPTTELLQSIEKVGLLQPLVVNDYGDGSYELLVGNTRAEAWRILYEQKKVPSVWVSCRFVHLNALEAERLLIESNRQRVKTEDQKNREAVELLRIETELAKQRMLAGKADPTRKSGEGGEAIERVAKVLDESPDTTRKRVAIASAGVTQGDRSVNRAYREDVKPKNREKINEGSAIAKDLSRLFKDGEVTRSKREGLFHLTIRNLSPEQIKKLAKSI